MAGNLLAFSGGKDSTALALREAEIGGDFDLFFTPTGWELPELLEHIARAVALTGKRLIVKTAGFGLTERVKHYESLPNSQMRWCTRELKIEPCKAHLLANPGTTLLVGLRADEEHREGMWGDFATYRYPMREWGWGIGDVTAYLDRRGVVVPERTDCDLCYDQRLSEWFKLWKEHPERFAKGEALEELTGHTFRSDTRDTWPASLKGLRFEFESGRVPTGGKYGIVELPLFGEYATKTSRQKCRICSM